MKCVNKLSTEMKLLYATHVRMLEVKRRVGKNNQEISEHAQSIFSTSLLCGKIIFNYSIP